MYIVCKTIPIYYALYVICLFRLFAHAFITWGLKRDNKVKSPPHQLDSVFICSNIKIVPTLYTYIYLHATNFIFLMYIFVCNVFKLER